MRARLAFALVLMLLATSSALAAPPYPFDGLLRRSQTVFLADLSGKDARSITFVVAKVLRGKPPSPAHFAFDSEMYNVLPKGATRYVLISQGGDHWGAVTNKLTVGQQLDGQASYVGWIAFPVLPDGEVAGAFLVPKRGEWHTVMAKEVEETVARSPFKPEDR